MLTAVWGGMLADSQPFEAPEDGSALGIEQLLALTLVARADPSWALPAQLRSKAVASALRTQAREANQWIGFGSQRVVFYEVDEDRTLVVLLATIAPIRSIMEKKRDVMGYSVSGREVMLGTAFPSNMDPLLGVLLSGIPKFFGAVSKNLHQALSNF